jgi:hypothetical protein
VAEKLFVGSFCAVPRIFTGKPWRSAPLVTVTACMYTAATPEPPDSYVFETK